jgi:two-component system sensor histidine kinase PfeS
MNRRLLWKLCLVIATGTVALFYIINVLTSRAEEGMSMIAPEHRAQLRAWGLEAERMYLAGDKEALRHWLENLQTTEHTWAGVVESELRAVSGTELTERFYEAFTLGRNVDWKIHLYFADNPIIEFRFADRHAHFVILLPERMRPGIYWGYASMALQIILPMILLTILSIILYRHIMNPLRELERATRAFSQGNLAVRVRQQLGSRSDELSELAATFDQMADRTGELIVSQRQLIADLSHELRTPLARLDIALDNLQRDRSDDSIERIQRESRQIRRLVEDTLTLAWLDNERPALQQETLDLVDLLDVICEDAQFEFPDRQLQRQLPGSAQIDNSSHRALGQALENVIRNGLCATPTGGDVSVRLECVGEKYRIQIRDQGPGVPAAYLERIFEPFFRLDKTSGSAVDASRNGFGLGLALARRQLRAVGGSIFATNLCDGLQMTITLPRQARM